MVHFPHIWRKRQIVAPIFARAGRVHRAGFVRYAALLVAGALTASCSGLVNDALTPECGDDKTTVVLSASTAAVALTNPALETDLDQGFRYFSWTFLVENICADAHAKPFWQLITDKTKLPPGWNVSAGWVTTPVTSGEVTLPPHDDGSLRTYSAYGDIGMEQGSVGGVGRLAVWIEFGFESQGNIDVDREVARQLLQALDMTVAYKLPKTD